jgi:hypothetical protein
MPGGLRNISRARIEARERIDQVSGSSNAAQAKGSIIGDRRGSASRDERIGIVLILHP